MFITTLITYFRKKLRKIKEKSAGFEFDFSAFWCEILRPHINFLLLESMNEVYNAHEKS